MNIDDFNIDELVNEITTVTSDLVNEQDEIEKQLEIYTNSKEETRKALENWINLTPTTTEEPKEQKEKETTTQYPLPPEEQYNQPTSWILLKRVLQGKDWNKGRIDKKEVKGVVFGVRKDGDITVKWDDGDKTHCRWGKDGCYDVVAIIDSIDMKRVDPKEQIKMNAAWLIGRKVKRGRDWKWQDQDGGSHKFGIVLSAEGKGWVNVKWESGKVNQYRWGADDSYDIEAVFD